MASASSSRTGKKPTESTYNITLGENPPSLYEAIQDANIRALTRELTSPSYDPEQTFSVTITSPREEDTISTELTPLQYAALKGLKGTVRYLLNNSTPDFSKTINKLPVDQAIQKYRKEDVDKKEIISIFKIVKKALEDAMDDFTSGLNKNSKYGNLLSKDSDKKLAKKIYDREYDDLKTPKPLSATAPKPTSILIEDAKKAGTEDGSKDTPKNPEYLATASPPKTPQEQEAYGKAYDKALAAYYGERDAKLNEGKDIGKLSNQFSTHYSDPIHQAEVERIYSNTHEKNRSRSSDLVKEAGYVGTYPPSQTLLSGNFFGFGSDISKIVGFTTSGTTPKTDTDAQYKEGLVEFVKNVQSLIGQAKYAGYTDGRKKNTKYTSPGKIVVNGKEYAVDFGKLNTQLIDLPAVSDTGVLQETEESGEAERILTELRRMRDSVQESDSLQGMIDYLRVQSETNNNPKIKQILKTIVVSQKGGASLLDKERLRKSILDIKNDSMKTGFLNLVDDTDYTNIDDKFNLLKTQVETELVSQKKEDIRLLIEQLPEEQRANYLRLLETTNDLTNLNIFESRIKSDPIFNRSQEEDSDPPKQTISAKNIDGIKLRIAKLKNGTTKQALQDRAIPTLTAQEYRALDIDVAKAYNRELGLLATIKTLADLNIRQTLLNEYNVITDEVAMAALETKVNSEVQRNPLAVKIQTLKDKKDFETRFRNPGENMDILKKLVDDQYTLENPGIGERLQSGIVKATSAVQDASSAVGKSVVTGLGTVTTKSQLYNLVQQTFSNIPKYITEKLKDIPGGISPDDPSLEKDVHPIKRVQVMYDKEFERGYKEAVKPTGGTRRKSKKSNRITKKKQLSKR